MLQSVAQPRFVGKGEQFFAISLLFFDFTNKRRLFFTYGVFFAYNSFISRNFYGILYFLLDVTYAFVCQLCHSTILFVQLFRRVVSKTNYSSKQYC